MAQFDFITPRALWEVVTSVYGLLGGVLLLFYKKAISDLELSTGYHISGLIEKKRGSVSEADSTLTLSSKKLRYMLLLFPAPIFAEPLNKNQYDTERSRLDSQLLGGEGEDILVFEGFSEDFAGMEPAIYLKLVSQEEGTPRVIASSNNVVVVPNVVFEATDPMTRRRISLVEFRVTKAGVLDSGVSTDSAIKINFRAEWDGRARWLGRAMTWGIHGLLINSHKKAYRSLPERIWKKLPSRFFI